MLLSFAAGLVLAPALAVACPYCNAPGTTTFVAEVAQADLILYGTLANAQRDPDDPGGLNKGTTDLTIETVIKSHDFIKGKKKITIPKYLPPDGKEYKYLIYFNVVNGQLDPYRGEAFSLDSKLPEYLKGAIEIRQKDSATRLRYFFDYLESPDIAISGDAYGEFAVADYKEICEVAPKLPAEVLLKWLKDPNTRNSRFGLYGLILGHCGKPSDAKAIRELIDDKNRSFTSGLDGVATGYIMLNPKEGWDYLIDLIKDPNKEFPIKYAALKISRFFWEFRSDLIPNSQVLEAMKLLVDNPTIADMPIEDLRKWKAWELTPLVLSYAKKESHSSIKIIYRAILKFAIAASTSDPKNKDAVEFVKAARARDAKQVEFLEELLKDELKPTLSAGKKETAKPGG
jgi:hypothetical protein